MSLSYRPCDTPEIEIWSAIALLKNKGLENGSLVRERFGVNSMLCIDSHDKLGSLYSNLFVRLM